MWRTLGIIGLSFWLGSAVLAQEAKTAAKKSRFESHWVVIMEMGEKAGTMKQEKITALKKQHLRYMSELEKSGEVRISSGFRVHDDERHRELAFYRSDLERAKVEELANGSPIVEAGYWKPYIYPWTTRNGAVKFGSDG